MRNKCIVNVYVNHKSLSLREFITELTSIKIYLFTTHFLGAIFRDLAVPRASVKEAFDSLPKTGIRLFYFPYLDKQGKENKKQKTEDFFF